MKIANKNRKFILYLVIFILILILFFVLITNKSAIVRKLQRDFGMSGNRIVENLNEPTDGLNWIVYDGDNHSPITLAQEKNMNRKASGQNAINFASLDTITNNNIRMNDSNHNYTMILSGFFVPNIEGNWKFRINSDDAAFVWIGDAISDINAAVPDEYWNNNNLILSLPGTHGVFGQPIVSNEINFKKDTNYPIRIQYSEWVGDRYLKFEWLPPSGAWSSDGKDLFYSAVKFISSKPKPKLEWKAYNGYFNGDMNFIRDKKPALLKDKNNNEMKGITDQLQNLSSITDNKIIESHSYLAPDLPKLGHLYFTPGVTTPNPNCTNHHQFTIEFVGNFQPSSLGRWDFFLSGDNDCGLWIGDTAAESGTRTKENAVIYLTDNATKTGSYNFDSLALQPIRILYGEDTGAYCLRVGWREPGGSWTCNGAGCLFGPATASTKLVSSNFSTFNAGSTPSKS